ncbi:MAG: hypothetical protein GY828_03580 [Candidatus Gracilibacteria bacterium]|nr:hypothetical protein [Candidatus Gracilibacteria bacterium]
MNKNEYIKCYSQKDFIKAQKIYRDLGYKYRPDEVLRTPFGFSTFHFLDIEPQYKKELLVLLIDGYIYHATSDICEISKIELSQYIERDLKGNIVEKKLIINKISLKNRFDRFITRLFSIECERCLASRTAMKNSSITYRND